MSQKLPADVVPGFEEFYSPDESIEALEREIEQKGMHFGPGREMAHPMGVIYKGPWETAHDGVCIAVRRNACALRRTGMPVFLESFTHTHWNDGVVERAVYCELPKAVLSEIGHLSELAHKRTVAFIEHFVPSDELFSRLLGLIGGGDGSDMRRTMLKTTAAYVALEYDVMPEEWVRAYNMFGAVIVPCTRNAKWLRDAGVSVPVHVVPHSLQLRDPMLKVRGNHRKDLVQFLHVGKWEPRKNQHELIGGFLLAFTPEVPVRLVLKCRAFWKSKTYPVSVEESVKYWLTREPVQANGWTAHNCARAVVDFSSSFMSREDLAKLYERSSVYVSSGSAEGFDLPALDAKIAGLRLIHAGNGGPEDFERTGDWRFNGMPQVSPPPEYRAPAGARWPGIIATDFKKMLQDVFDSHRSGVHINSQFDASPYKIDAVGAQLRRVINELAAAVGADAWSYNCDKEADVPSQPADDGWKKGFPPMVPAYPCVIAPTGSYDFMHRRVDPEKEGWK